MTRVTAPIAAIASMPLARLQQELLRSGIVIGCALALIAAGAATPF